jgi:hypothetical protein
MNRCALPRNLCRNLSHRPSGLFKKFRDKALAGMFIRQQVALNFELMEYALLAAKRKEVCRRQKAASGRPRGPGNFHFRKRRLAA